MEALFLSDLHLSAERPEQLQQFRRLLRGPALGADAVYLLGDLFEHFWAGSDDTAAPNSDVIEELRRFAAAVPACHVLRGNRDLMIDGSFHTLTGWKLLPDRAVIELGGRRALLMHGDLLCTRDRAYQWFRSFMETTLVRSTFTALPLWLRTMLSRGLRPVLRRSAAMKSPDIVDVDGGAVRREMNACGAGLLIHGHTHRPGRHEVDLGTHRGERWVLGDWYGEGRVLVCEQGQLRLVSVPALLATHGVAATTGHR